MRKYNVLKRSTREPVSYSIYDRLTAEEIARDLWEVTGDEMILEKGGVFYNVKTGYEIEECDL